MIPVFTPNPDPFWLIWSPHGGVPTVKHPTEQDATNEACRLAEKHRERKFYVLRSTAEVENKVTQTALVKTCHGTTP